MDEKKNLFSEFPPVSREEWEEVIKNDLRGGNYKQKLNWNTGEGIDVLPFYRRQDLDVPRKPITTAGNDWEIRQPIRAQKISAANNIARKAVKNGAGALQFLIDIRQTDGALGGDLHGTAIQNQGDFSALIDGLNLSEVALHFDSGLVSPILLAMLHNEVKQQEVEPRTVTGSLGYDPYAFAITNGQLSTRENAPVAEAQQMLQFCSENLPGIKCLSVDARPYHNAGATIVQELGYALATGSEYMATLSDGGHNTDTIASCIHFNFAVGSNYFLEIAKLRAARLLWRKILDAYQVDKTKQAYVHTASSEWNKTLYDPYVNMLRSTTEGMSAAIAGADSITIQPFDASFREPDDFSRRIARNSQIILKEESYFHKVADPAAGSYYIETLTDKIADAAWNCFQEVETQGGILKSMRGGYIQTAIEESRNQRDMAIAQRERIFVGTNQYPNPDDEAPGESSKPTPAASLKETNKEVEIDRNRLIQSISNALEGGSALGDLVPALFDLTKLDVRIIRPYRGAQAFEELRQSTEAHEKTPTVLTLPLGSKKMRKARSSFAVNFFGCVGYDIQEPLGFESVDEAIDAVQKNHPDIVVLCSSDKEYEDLVPKLSKRLDSLDQKPITVLAGYPKDKVDEYSNNGIDEFIYSNCNVLETLQRFQQKLGIK